MNEITKLYENAGIKKTKGDCLLCPLDVHTCGRSYDECPHYYKPFTAEKQIAILKLLTQRCDLTISHFTEWEFIHFDGQEPIQVTGEDFAETFAKLINAYWQDLTEEEKTSIKNILEM